MYTTITRKIDELGRVVLPMDARKALNLSAMDEVEISWEEGKLTIKKAYPTCPICGSENDIEAIGICRSCIEKIKAN